MISMALRQVLIVWSILAVSVCTGAAAYAVLRWFGVSEGWSSMSSIVVAMGVLAQLRLRVDWR